MVNQNSLTEFLINELNQLPPDRGFYIKGDRGWLRCPYHAGGQENSPSYTVHLDPNKGPPVGWCGCFGCKQSCHWNVFAELFGLNLLTAGAVKEANASVWIGAQAEEPVPPDYTLFAPWPTATDWRRQKAKVLAKFQARSIHLGRTSRMYLPVIVYGENRGGIQCLLQDPKDDEKSYINTTGEWSKSALLGYDLARKRLRKNPGLPLWVVEGPRDTTNVYCHGGVVNGLIGSAVTKDKVSLILDLDPPSVIIATDPDDAGDNAASDLADALHNKIPAMRYPFKPDTDPAGLTKRQVEVANTRMMQLYGDTK